MPKPPFFKRGIGAGSTLPSPGETAATRQLAQQPVTSPIRTIYPNRKAPTSNVAASSVTVENVGGGGASGGSSGITLAQVDQEAFIMAIMFGGGW